MDGGAWWAAVHGVAKSWTWLRDFAFTFHFHALEKEMATHTGVLAWRVPGTGEPGGLPSVGSHRVGHDWSDLAAAIAAKKSSRSNGYWIINRTPRKWREKYVFLIKQENLSVLKDMSIRTVYQVVKYNQWKKEQSIDNSLGNFKMSRIKGILF